MAHKHILVAVDLTDEAPEVLTAARKVADQNTRVTSITVVKPLIDVYGGFDLVPYTQGSLSFEETARSHAQLQLEEMSQQYGIDDTIIVMGNPAAEIHEFAKNHDVDLIVIGTHGKHGLGLLLGSTANAVVHGAPCDLLAVKIAPESTG